MARALKVEARGADAVVLPGAPGHVTAEAAELGVVVLDVVDVRVEHPLDDDEAASLPTKPRRSRRFACSSALTSAAQNAGLFDRGSDEVGMRDETGIRCESGAPRCESGRFS